MNFQQLRIIRETVRSKFNLTEAANALFTSQSGVSKHIRDLEQELGVEIFVRRGKRLLGLTEPGKEVLNLANRMLVDADNLSRIAGKLRSWRRRNADDCNDAYTSPLYASCNHSQVQVGVSWRPAKPATSQPKGFAGDTSRRRRQTSRSRPTRSTIIQVYAHFHTTPGITRSWFRKIIPWPPRRP